MSWMNSVALGLVGLVIGFLITLLILKISKSKSKEGQILKNHWFLYILI